MKDFKTTQPICHVAILICAAIAAQVFASLAFNFYRVTTGVPPPVMHLSSLMHENPESTSTSRRYALLRHAAAAPNGPEPAPFYFFTPDEAESVYPSLKDCSLSVYAEFWHDFMASHPARVLRIQDATFAVWPGYTASEENWPVYGELWAWATSWQAVLSRVFNGISAFSAPINLSFILLQATYRPTMHVLASDVTRRL
jgi:hypothetical protein